MVISFFSRGTDRWTDRQTDRRTDRRTDRQTGFWNPHMEHVGTQKNLNSKLVVSRRSLYASPEVGDA